MLRDLVWKTGLLTMGCITLANAQKRTSTFSAPDLLALAQSNVSTHPWAAEMRDRVVEKPVHVAVMYAYVREEAEILKERVAAEFNCAELWLTEFSPVMGYATGTGTLGFAYYCDD